MLEEAKAALLVAADGRGVGAGADQINGGHGGATCTADG